MVAPMLGGTLSELLTRGRQLACRITGGAGALTASGLVAGQRADDRCVPRAGQPNSELDATSRICAVRGRRSRAARDDDAGGSLVVPIEDIIEPGQRDHGIVDVKKQLPAAFQPFGAPHVIRAAGNWTRIEEILVDPLGPNAR